MPAYLPALRQAVMAIASYEKNNRLLSERLDEELAKHAELANRDALTGMGNARFFDLELKRLLGSPRASHEGLAVIYCDLDNFKPINDTHGHAVGDLVLERFGERIGFHALSDVASMPLFMVLLSLFSLVITPAMLAFSRHHEREAGTTSAKRRNAPTYPPPPRSCRRASSLRTGSRAQHCAWKRDRAMSTSSCHRLQRLRITWIWSRR